MTELDAPVASLPDARCWELLRTQELGRLVTHVGDVVDVFPVNYVVDGEGILIRTAPGTKLLELTVNADVLFEVDHHTDTEAWSVIMRGRATALESEADIERAENAGLRPWIPTLKRVFVRIEPTRISGRAFRRDPEPERTGVAEY
ncbi:pyridoxamine 5'-phosphate oxidase family protein [Microbacterium esteraromaticum]|uniref:pyridoxamine 5'-phosphate oxidase family protein n=1 Tax=Microbacterium esteraromaticum TaxID=57043 RepID=UPI001C98C749|nr:pyridoxamine 5'-phosphate oxidase family protein [Microbacterium esteraromaticum]MBY6061582.1 pyridoxamine 5'-phosphate oxidase family protein [Microbacterium esteraromaticum]